MADINGIVFFVYAFGNRKNSIIKRRQFYCNVLQLVCLINVTYYSAENMGVPENETVAFCPAKDLNTSLSSVCLHLIASG